MATVAEIIAEIDDQIYALIQAPATMKYKIGDKTVDKAAALLAMRSMRETYTKEQQDAPYEDVRGNAYDVDEWGNEIVEYVGDA